MIRSYRSPRGSDAGDITLAVDPDLMTGVVNGCAWFGVNDGKPVFLSRLNDLPASADDEQILPFWNGGVCRKVFDVDERNVFSPSFQLSSLCGYYWTPEKYALESAKVESYGFFCMRSKRGTDGKYWEVWRLLGYWSARGALKEYIDDAHAGVTNEQIKLEKVCKWLCRNCSFGSLDVTVQRAAMCIPD